MIEKKPHTFLQQALDMGDEEGALRLLLSIPMDSELNGTDSTGETALHCAARKGFQKTCDELIRRKVDLNILSVQGHGPLHLAAQAGHPDLCAKLIQCGAEVDLSSNAFNSKGSTPLQLMCLHPSSGSLATLLSFGADFSKKNKDGNTALSLAAMSGNTRACIELLQAGADPMEKFRGCTAAGLASRHKCKETASQIKAWMASKKATDAIHSAMARVQLNIPMAPA